MKEIKFNDNYPKLHGQTAATLIAVSRIKIDTEKDKELLKYDTKKSDGTYYEIKDGLYIQLVFLGDKAIPFCTLRSALPAHKVEQYKAQIGKPFKIVIEKEEQK